MSRIITIGRQFGSGGRELGRRLAQELKIEYYDREILGRIAEDTAFAEEYIQNVLERQPHNLLPITVGRSFADAENYAFHQAQSVYQSQSRILHELAEKTDCVIIGRCADYILRDLKPLRIFVYADDDSRVRRCMEHRREEEVDVSEKQMLRRIHSMDRERTRYYDFYTGLKWGDKCNYDLCVNTSGKSIKELVPAIAKLFD